MVVASVVKFVRCCIYGSPRCFWQRKKELMARVSIMMLEMITSPRMRTFVVEVMLVVLDVRTKLYGRKGLFWSRRTQKLIAVGR